jgi:hypothetical protein
VIGQFLILKTVAKLIINSKKMERLFLEECILRLLKLKMVLVYPKKKKTSILDDTISKKRSLTAYL